MGPYRRGWEEADTQALRSGPIGLMPRVLELVVTTEIDMMPVDRLPRLRLDGDPTGLRLQVQNYLAPDRAGLDEAVARQRLELYCADVRAGVG